MKMAKAQKIQPKSTSRRFDTKIESATGIDVADLIIGFLEANASYGKTETKGVG